MNIASRLNRLLLPVLVALLAISLLPGCGSDKNKREANTERVEEKNLEPTSSSCTIGGLGSPLFGTVLVDWSAIDLPASFIDILIEYSIDGGINFFPATQGNGGDGTIALIAEPDPGYAHIFAWDTLTDLPQSVAGPVGNVVFRISPVESSGSGAPLVGDVCVTGTLTVNNSPSVLDLGSLTSGMAQEDETIAVIFTNAIPSSDPVSITFDVIYDSSLITIKDAQPCFAGPPCNGVAPAGSITTFMPISPGQVRVTIQSPTPFPDGQIVELICDTACLQPRPLPASAPVVCDSPSAENSLANPVSIVCGAAGSVSIVDNSSVVDIPDFEVNVGGAITDVQVNYTNGVPSINADQLTITMLFDPLVFDFTGVLPGPDLDPAGTVNYTATGPGQATLVITNPPGLPFADGTLAILQAIAVAATAQSTQIVYPVTEGSQQLGPCAVVAAVQNPLSPTTTVTVLDQRTLTLLLPVSGLGDRGIPVQSNVVGGNPKGDFAPLNFGELNDTISLLAGGNPVLFYSTLDAPFQVVLEANWSIGPTVTNVADAANADGTTTYTVLTGAGNVDVSGNGLLTPMQDNACSTFQATFTPNNINAFGPPTSVRFGACVDLGGVDNPTRSANMAVGDLDADIPGLPTGDPLVGAGGQFSLTVYVNAGAQSLGAVQTTTLFNQAVIEVDTAYPGSSQGVEGSTFGALGGPTAVNTLTPGQVIINHLTVALGFTGVFDIWTHHYNVLVAGTTDIDHTVDNLVDNAVALIGPPQPHPAIAANTGSGPGITFP